jgi:hypothetical protein
MRDVRCVTPPRRCLSAVSRPVAIGGASGADTTGIASDWRPSRRMPHGRSITNAEAVRARTTDPRIGRTARYPPNGKAADLDARHRTTRKPDADKDNLRATGAQSSQLVLACFRCCRRPARGSGHRPLPSACDRGDRSPDRALRAIAVVDRRSSLICSESRCQSRNTTLRRELCTFKPPLYSMNPSFRNLFMKKLTRERVVPTISASVSWDTRGSVRWDASGSP